MRVFILGVLLISAGYLVVQYYQYGDDARCYSNDCVE